MKTIRFLLALLILTGACFAQEEPVTEFTDPGWFQSSIHSESEQGIPPWSEGGLLS